MSNKLSALKRLEIQLIARHAIPKGGGVADGVEFFMNEAHRRSVVEQAQADARIAIRLVRSASDPNPWRDADDETIAAELMRRIDERNAKERPWTKLSR